MGGENLGGSAAGGKAGAGGTGGVGGLAGPGGTAGAGGGGETFCVPGDAVSCYSGPAPTSGVGACTPGTQTCASDGSAYGPCLGEVLPVVENCATTADEDCDGSPGPLACGTAAWSFRFGDALQQSGVTIAVDANDDVIVAGRFEGTMDLGGGPLVSGGASDVFIAKWSSSGGFLWSRQLTTIAGSSNGIAPAVAVDAAGNVVVTGRFQGTADFGAGTVTSAGGDDAFVLKLSPTGDHLWSKSFGDGGFQQGMDVAVDASGAVLLAVYTEDGAVDLGGGPIASPGNFAIAILGLLDADGNHQWSKSIGGWITHLEVAFDPQGQAAVGGAAYGSADLGGGPLGFSDCQLFLGKIDVGGNHQWSKGFTGGVSGDGDECFGAVAVGPAGEVVFGGMLDDVPVDFGAGALPSNGDRDAFLARFAPDGSLSFAQRFGGPAQQLGLAVAVDSAGHAIWTGITEEPIDLGSGSLTPAGGFVAKVGPGGTLIWSAPHAAVAHSIVVDSTDHLLLTGRFDSSVDFGAGTLTSAGQDDGFVVKLGP